MILKLIIMDYNKLKEFETKISNLFQLKFNFSR